MAKKAKKEKAEKTQRNEGKREHIPGISGLENLRQPLAQWWQSVSSGYLKTPEPEAAITSDAQTLLHLHNAESHQEACATLCGLHESLDQSGYQHILETGNEESLASFLLRLAASQGNDISEETEFLIHRLARECWWEKKEFGEVMLCLGMPLSGDVVDSSPSTATDLLSGTLTTLQSDILPPPSEVAEEAKTLSFVVEPSAGSARGGTAITWRREPVPTELRFGARHAAPLQGGCFLTPYHEEAEDVDLIAVFADGTKVCYASGFSYFLPGTLEALRPASGTSRGGVEIEVMTSDLGAEICQVCLGGQECQMVGRPSAFKATVVTPPVEEECLVTLSVTACNGNTVQVEEAFTYIDTLTFGAVGSAVEVADDGRQVRKGKGVMDGVCLSAQPIRRSARGHFFQIRIDEMGTKNMRALAVGIAQIDPSADLLGDARTRPQEATGLSRAWMLGYDRGGPLFAEPGASPTKLRTGAWRPAVDLETGSIIGVLFTGDEFVLLHDGKERARLSVSPGMKPGPEDQLHAVLDLQGAARAASFVTSLPMASAMPAVASETQP